jgi:acid phosphatase (class A)
MKITHFGPTLFAALLAITPLERVEAGFTILTPQEIHAIIGPYPATGSEAENVDFDVLLHWQNTRSPQECARADRDHSDSFENLFAGPQGPLTAQEGRGLRPYMARFTWAIDLNIGLSKAIYRRPRPYTLRPEIEPCISRPGSWAYPSGHSMSARVFARILSKRYPARANAFMKRADEAALNRVIGGVHHPSDIEAGKKLGDVIAERLVGR